MKSSLKNLLRPGLRLVDPLRVAMYRLFLRPEFPIPPFDYRIRGRGIRRFFDSGENCYLPLKRAVDKYAGDLGREKTILEFGAGTGRVLQFFQRDFSDVYGVEIDAKKAEYLAETFPLAKIQQSEPQPPLKFDDKFFDVVYSVSVWTHLPKVAQMAWLQEMSRILKPGGIALITTAGLASLKKRRERGLPGWEQFDENDLEKNGIIYIEYANLAHPDKYKNIESDWGLTIVSESYIRRTWSSTFDILEFRPNVVEIQDLVVMRKRTA